MNPEAKNESTRWSKPPKPGGRVMNRYRITGTLTCRTPLHVGSGEESDDIDALVQTDYLGIPILTGSGLRGVIRHALLDAAGDDQAAEARVFALLGPDAEHAGEDDATSGKVCFRDAKRQHVEDAVVWHQNAAPQWNQERGTYQITSVVIDPRWGTCEEHLLYNMEVVPKGTKFEVEIIGNNLLDEEVGMLLWTLDKFNDSSGAVSVGAHSGRGFGRLSWNLGKIRLLGSRLNEAASGVATAPLKERILSSLAQKKVVSQLDGVDVADAGFEAVRPKAGRTDGGKYHLELSYSLTVASGLVVRSGDTGEAKGKKALLEKFRLAQEENSKERGLQFLLSAPGKAPDASEVASLAWQVVLDRKGNPQAQFQVAGSGVRGAMRKHLQKRLVIEKGDDATAQGTLDELFGTTKHRGRIEFENAIPEGDKLRWLSEDHQSHNAGPTCKNPNVLIRERGPVDRITQGARHGGLHHFMSVEKGSTFRGRILIRNVTARDLSPLRLWSASLNQKLVVLGGVAAAGYGECTIGFDTQFRLLHAASLDPAELLADDPLKHAIDGLVHPGQPVPGDQIKDPSAQLPNQPVQNTAAVAPQPTGDPHAHYMNPFDFVPFPRQGEGDAYIEPRRRTAEQWETEVPNAGELLSGTITVKLNTLQPVHILGRWHGGKESFYSFHREADVPVIPGASWRGMLRAFIEARWNCWVSSYSRNADWHAKQTKSQPNLPKTPNPYSRQYGERYVGFNTETQWRDCSPVSGWKHDSDPAIPHPLLPPEPETGDWGARPIDLATFLFGTVLQFRARDGEPPKAESPALGGRLRFGNSYLRAEQLDRAFWIPDQPGAALIGGPKPSKSSMFYFRYGTVVHRITRGNHIAQFVAGPFRGRKFYFHQNWQACVQSYQDPRSSENFWAQGRSNVTRRTLECLKTNERGAFEIHFERLPWCFLRLLLSAIENPGTEIRHKLGYAKPFGFGSVQLEVADITVYSVEGKDGSYSLVPKKVDLDDLRRKALNARAANWEWACDPPAFTQSDRWLRYILAYPSDPASLTLHLFSYPGYKQSTSAPDWVRGFARPNSDPGRVLTGIPNVHDSRAASISDAKLYDADGKKTLDIGLYQRRSTHFEAVCTRAEVSANDIHTEAGGANPSPPGAGGGGPGATPGGRRQPVRPAANSPFTPRTKRGEKRR